MLPSSMGGQIPVSWCHVKEEWLIKISSKMSLGDLGVPWWEWHVCMYVHVVCVCLCGLMMIAIEYKYIFKVFILLLI